MDAAAEQAKRSGALHQLPLIIVVRTAQQQHPRPSTCCHAEISRSMPRSSAKAPWNRKTTSRRPGERGELVLDIDRLAVGARGAVRQCREIAAVLRGHHRRQRRRHRDREIGRLDQRRPKPVQNSLYQCRAPGIE